MADRPSYERIVDELATVTKALLLANAGAKVTTSDQHRCLCNQQSNAEMLLEEAGHEDYNQRVRLANMVERGEDLEGEERRMVVKFLREDTPD